MICVCVGVISVCFACPLPSSCLDGGALSGRSALPSLYPPPLLNTDSDVAKQRLHHVKGKTASSQAMNRVALARDPGTCPRPSQSPETQAFAQDPGTCLRPWLLPKTMELAQDHGTCPRPLQSPETHALAQHPGTCPRPRHLPETLALARDPAV